MENIWDVRTLYVFVLKFKFEKFCTLIVKAQIKTVFHSDKIYVT